MVSLVLLMLVLAASLPMLLGMLRSSVTSKYETQAKNLGQERLEQLKNLRFHVDRQNGPFLDLLDIYFTNAPTTPTPTTVAAGGTNLSGTFVTSGSRSPGEPAFPFYRTTTGPLPSATRFSQVVDAQFLGVDGVALAASRFQGTYDSQTVGRDQAPSPLVGITVITSWNDGARARTLRTTTRITEGRAALPDIQSQARAVAVDITSTAADGTTLELQAGVANADGAQSSGSSVSGYAAGAVATKTGVTPVSGRTSKFALPTTAVVTSGSAAHQEGTACSWYGFGATAVTNVTGDISTGLPKAPTDVNAAATPRTFSGQISENGAGPCGQISYDNLASGGTARPTLGTDLLGYEMGAAPYLRAVDGSGSGASILGGVYVSSNDLISSPQKSVAGANATMAHDVVLFPNNPESGGRGLFSARLTSASVDCVSGSASANGTVVGKYALTIGWWGRAPSDTVARWHTASWTYDSSTNSAPVVVSGSDVYDPVNTLLNNGTRLSQLVTSPATSAVPAVVSTGATSGQRGFSAGVFSFTSASTLVNETAPGYSAVTVQLGQLSCVADDQR